jgi:hypothetical protein
VLANSLPIRSILRSNARAFPELHEQCIHSHMQVVAASQAVPTCHGPAFSETSASADDSVSHSTRVDAGGGMEGNSASCKDVSRYDVSFAAVCYWYLFARAAAAKW